MQIKALDHVRPHLIVAQFEDYQLVETPRAYVPIHWRWLRESRHTRVDFFHQQPWDIRGDKKGIRWQSEGVAAETGKGSDCQRCPSDEGRGTSYRKRNCVSATLGISLVAILRPSAVFRRFITRWFITTLSSPYINPPRDWVRTAGVNHTHRRIRPCSRGSP